MLFGVTTSISRRGPLQPESLRAGLQRLQGLLHLVLIPTLLLSLGPLVLLFIDAGKTADQFEAHPWTLTLPYHFKNYWVMAGGMSRYILNSSIISAIAIPFALALASYTSYVFAPVQFSGERDVLLRDYHVDDDPVRPLSRAAVSVGVEPGYDEHALGA